MKTKLIFLLSLTFLFLFSGSVYGEEEVKKEYWDNGKLKSEIHLKDGRRHGVQIGWFKSGVKRFQVYYKEGKLDGPNTSWYESEGKELEANFKNGKKEGRATWWYESGGIKTELQYLEGRENGFFTAWYESGEKKAEGHHKNGRLDGIQTQFNEDGTKNREAIFKDGEKISEEIFKKSGSIKAWILKSIEPLTLTVIILKIFFNFFWICQHDYFPIFQGAGGRPVRTLLAISGVVSRLFSWGYLICWAILINISSALWLFGFSWLGSNCLNLIKFLPGPEKFGLPQKDFILCVISLIGFIFLPILGFLLIKQF